MEFIIDQKIIMMYNFTLDVILRIFMTIIDSDSEYHYNCCKYSR